MNDKQQLAAMGEHVASMKLTIHGHGINSEEEASGGFLTRCLPCSSQQQQTPCMAKRIEELEAQLAEKSIKVERLREMNLIAMKRVDGMLDRDLELSRLQSLMSEGWQLVPVEATDHMTWVGQSMRYDAEISIGSIYCAMIAAAPSPDNAK